MFDYIRAYCLDALGDKESAKKCAELGNRADTGLCFPSRLGDIAVLERAMTLDEKGANAYYYLGCLRYDRFSYEKAVSLWEKAIELDPTHGKAYPQSLRLRTLTRGVIFCRRSTAWKKHSNTSPTNRDLSLNMSRFSKT